MNPNPPNTMEEAYQRITKAVEELKEGIVGYNAMAFRRSADGSLSVHDTAPVRPSRPDEATGGQTLVRGMKYVMILPERRDSNGSYGGSQDQAYDVVNRLKEIGVEVVATIRNDDPYAVRFMPVVNPGPSFEEHVTTLEKKGA